MDKMTNVPGVFFVKMLLCFMNYMYHFDNNCKVVHSLRIK